MASFIRRLVSANKRRFQDDGYDLDLAYITGRIVAMGFPGEGAEGLYRNPMGEVARFLAQRHPGCARVYNLCSEKRYSAESMQAPVVCFPFDDHQTPPLKLVQEFCADAMQWLQDSPSNVVVVHCKAGKGRTGVMICCLLMHLAQFAPALLELMGAGAATGGPEPTMQLYAQRRTTDLKGVTIASQRRYIRYYSEVLAGGALLPATPLCLHHISIGGLPASLAERATLVVRARPSDAKGPEQEWVVPAVRLGGSSSAACCLALDASAVADAWDDDACAQAPAHAHIEDQRLRVSFPHAPTLRTTSAPGGLGSASPRPTRPTRRPHVVEGDVRVSLLLRGSNQLFCAWLNTGFVASGGDGGSITVELEQEQLDKVPKGLPHRLSLEVVFTPCPADVIWPPARRPQPSPAGPPPMTIELPAWQPASARTPTPAAGAAAGATSARAPPGWGTPRAPAHVPAPAAAQRSVAQQKPDTPQKLPTLQKASVPAPACHPWEASSPPHSSRSSRSSVSSDGSSGSPECSAFVSPRSATAAPPGPTAAAPEPPAAVAPALITAPPARAAPATRLAPIGRPPPQLVQEEEEEEDLTDQQLQQHADQHALATLAVHQLLALAWVGGAGSGGGGGFGSGFASGFAKRRCPPPLTARQLGSMLDVVRAASGSSSDALHGGARDSSSCRAQLLQGACLSSAPLPLRPHPHFMEEWHNLSSAWQRHWGALEDD